MWISQRTNIHQGLAAPSDVVLAGLHKSIPVPFGKQSSNFSTMSWLELLKQMPRIDAVALKHWSQASVELLDVRRAQIARVAPCLFLVGWRR
jgi:hypothetical protein